MARTFNGNTANFLRATSAPITAGPLTLAAHFNRNVSTDQQTILSLGTDNATPGYFVLNIRGAGASNDLGGGLVQNASGVFVSGSSAAPSTGVWHHGAVCFTTSDLQAFFNGASADGASAHSLTPGNINRTTVGVRQAAVGAVEVPMNGAVAWPCIWNIDLRTVSGAIAALAAGVHPLLIAPQAIVFFAPLTGASSADEIDIIGARTLVETGTVGTAESPLVSLGSPMFVTREAAGAIEAALALAVEAGYTASALATLESALTLGVAVDASAASDAALEAAIALAVAVQTATDGDVPTAGVVEAALALAVSAGVSTTAQQDAQAALTLAALAGMSASALAVLEAAVTLAAQADTAASAGLDLDAALTLAASAALTADGDISIEAQLTLAATVAVAQVAQADLQAAVTMAAGMGYTVTAQADLESALALAASAGLDVTAGFNLEAALALGMQAGFTAEGVNAGVVVITTPDGRTIVVASADRTITIAAARRTITLQ